MGGSAICVCSSLNLALYHEDQPVNREKGIMRTRRILQHPIPSTLDKFIQPPEQSPTSIPGGITLRQSAAAALLILFIFSSSH